MAFSSFKFNWKDSLAHLHLLSGFITPTAEKEFTESDLWKSVLKETPKKAIDRFIDEGMIEKASLAGALDYKYKVSDLKAKLKELGLKVSGKKAILIDRLILADKERMNRDTKGLNVLQCSEQGRVIAEQYKIREKEKRAKFEELTYQALKQYRFQKSSKIKATYEAERVFPSNIHIDWKHYDTTHDVRILEIMFNNKPKILNSLTDDQMKHLRIAAGMMFLWRYNIISNWLPDNFKTELVMDNNTAARMLYSYALHREDIAQYKAEKIKVIEISCLDDACDACK